jgi:hypothetical protein
VDGFYFLNIEEILGTDAATNIDKKVWEKVGTREAKKLKELFDLKNDIPSMIKGLRLSSWSLDLEDKEVIVEKDRAIFRVLECRIQKTRIKKGLGEFPCKSVRLGFLESFAKEFNPDIVVTCNMCPPDHHFNIWCEWEFRK